MTLPSYSSSLPALPTSHCCIICCASSISTCFPARCGEQEPFLKQAAPASAVWWHWRHRSNSNRRISTVLCAPSASPSGLTGPALCEAIETCIDLQTSSTEYCRRMKEEHYCTLFQTGRDPTQRPCCIRYSSGKRIGRLFSFCTTWGPVWIVRNCRSEPEHEVTISFEDDD